MSVLNSKGIASRDVLLFKVLYLISIFFMIAAGFYLFLAALLGRKVNIKFLIASFQ